MEKKVKIQFEASLENQSLARAMVAAYLVPLDPLVEEITEIKTAVSEAVGNAVIHGYKNNRSKRVTLELAQTDTRKVIISIIDTGVGIEDVERARLPLFTTLNLEDCSGMGFTVMESFMDRVIVNSEPGEGTTVTLIKQLDKIYE